MSYAIRTYLETALTEEESANRGAMRNRLLNARDALEAAYANWDSLSPAQKDNASKMLLRVVAGLVRLELNEYESAGV